MSTGRIVLIDNYDSFTFNLVQRLGELGARCHVVRNDVLDLDGLRALEPSKLVVSPGPCTPDEAGISIEAIRAFANEIPILGVCLGHQALAQALGGRVVRARTPVHGKAHVISHSGSGLFEGLPDRLEVGRYHSLVVERESLPEELEVSATTEEGEIMALRHRTRPVFGVQFHPESILTPDGSRILSNFLAIS